jgi:hypothetical protein
VLTLKFFLDDDPHEKYLPLITEMSNRAPHLEQFTIFDNRRRFWKRVRGEWVFCGEEESWPLPR